ncbi:hypothetical protein [Paenibacillus kandeliae]|uniref:hypothetical protein n=1 Tax=Paenibacillus kandeliae TaxID=3231269 RepID=UPI003457D3F0
MIEEQFKNMHDIMMRFDQQIDYVTLHEEWKELGCDFDDHFQNEQSCNELKMEWDTYASNVYGLSTHQITHPNWQDALWRYKWYVLLEQSFFDRWKRYRFLQYYDLSCYPNIYIEMESMEQLRVYSLKLIRDLNHQYRAYNKYSGIIKV